MKIPNRDGPMFVAFLPVAWFFVLAAVLIGGCDESEPIPLSSVPLTAPTHTAEDNHSQPMNAANPMNATNLTSTQLAWSVPQSWVEQPVESQMRLAQWRIAGSETNEAVECRVARSGGSVEANLSIWMGQFSVPDGQSLDDQVINNHITDSGLDVTTLELSGTYSTREPPMTGDLVDHEHWGMFGSVIVAPEGLYLFKCVGPEESILQNRSIFDGFIQSLTVEDAPESGVEP